MIEQKPQDRPRWAPPLIMAAMVGEHRYLLERRDTPMLACIVARAIALDNVVHHTLVSCAPVGPAGLSVAQRAAEDWLAQTFAAENAAWHSSRPGLFVSRGGDA